jgi:hypothetical protein
MLGIVNTMNTTFAQDFNDPAHEMVSPCSTTLNFQVNARTEGVCSYKVIAEFSASKAGKKYSYNSCINTVNSVNLFSGTSYKRHSS